LACAQSRPRAGVAIGDFVLELHQLAKYGLLEVEAASPGRLEEIFLEVGDMAMRPTKPDPNICILNPDTACAE
jgi:hypothetical protein